MTEPDRALSMVFGGPGAERFEAFKADAAGAPLNFAQFAQLPSVQRWLGDLEGQPGAPESPEAISQLLTFLYVGFRYWNAGNHVWPVDRATLEPRLVKEVAAPPTVPHGACLLRFPDRWFWGQIAPDHPHEPLHSIMISGPEATPTPRDEYTLVALFGLHEHREGVSEVALTATAGEFVAAFGEMRDPPYAPLMDGGERAGFKSIASPAELLHLAHVALALTAR